MKASGAAAAGRGKSSPAATDHAPPYGGPALPLLQFGDTLYKSFTQKPEYAAAKLPLTRYADYLHHFGFSVEREICSDGAAHLNDALRKPQPTTRSSPSLASGHLINCSTEDLSALVDTADWGIGKELKSEADQRCESVGAIAGVSDWEAVAKQLTTPFNVVTWRQTPTQCAVKKARCIYAWLCAHVRLQLRPPDKATENADGSLTAAAAVAGNATKPSRSVSSSKKTNRPSRNKKEVATAQEPAGPVEPLAQALAARRATPQLLAQLYASMLVAVGVKCEAVAGQRKGTAPGETVEWAWNVVRIEGRSYLVDVAAALSDDVLRSSSLSDSATAASAATISAATAAPAGDNAKTPITGSARNTDGAAAAAATSTSDGAVAHRNVLSDEADATAGYDAPRLLSATPFVLRRDFFFFTHPCSFLSSHLPSNAGLSLVSVPTKAVHWALQPCVTPAFYHYGLQLTSHPTHAAISVGSTPLYLSLMNRAPGTTELCCVLFAGTLQTLSEDISRWTPLGQRWVWHQRDDTTNIETFTLTVPQAGYYVAVVGARAIRADPYCATIVAPAEVAFTPVVTYEVRVGFTSSGVPVLPLQCLSPSICRLMYPLCAQIAPGRQRFSVMPSCSNVLAVAVVRRAAPQQQLHAAVTTSFVEAPNTDGNNSSDRFLICFLPFQMKRVAFEGFAEVKTGNIIELWVLYGAPDRNGQKLAQRVGAPKTSAFEAPAVADAKTVTDKIKHKGHGAELLPVVETQVSRFEHALSRGELFQLFVGNIEVKHFISPTALSVIQPQPTVEQEQAATLRRLAGVTDALLREADQTAQYQATPVGSYFGAVATTTAMR